MTRQEVINELTDIRAAIEADGELVAEDSLDALATKLMEEGSTDISEVELDTINAMIYDSFVDPETICVELINMLMSTVSTVEEDIDPFVDDIWDDLSDEEVAALTSDDGVNWAEYPDHEYQEGCDGKECKEEVEAPAEATEEGEVVEEAYYGKDSLIAGDIPGKSNGFVELISMRFHNMGFDEIEHPLFPGRAEQMWNPFGADSVVMYGDSKEFFDPIVAYIESEVGREDSAWYNRDYEVCEVEGKDSSNGPWALCIEAREYDQGEPDLIPMAIKAEYARRRKLRKVNDKPAA